MSMKDVYQKKLEAQLQEWNAEIEKLKAKARKAEANTQAKYQEKLDEISRKQDAAKAKLAELQNSSEKAWEDLKSGIENAWKNLEDAVKSAASYFK